MYIRFRVCLVHSLVIIRVGLQVDDIHVRNTENRLDRYRVTLAEMYMWQYKLSITNESQWYPSCALTSWSLKWDMD